MLRGRPNRQENRKKKSFNRENLARINDQGGGREAGRRRCENILDTHRLKGSIFTI